MKKCIKYILLIVLMLVLSGCHAMYPIKVVTSDKNYSNKIADILIPLEENGSDYVELGSTSKMMIKEDEEKIKLSEISRYNADGYRSMLVHYGLEDYHISKGDNGNNTGTVFEIYLNGKDEYNDLCDKYKTFKIAFIDDKGNIVKVSDEYSFKTSKHVYLNSTINYDSLSNGAKPEYIYEETFLAYLIMFLSEALTPIMPVLSILTLILLIINNEHKFYHSLIFLLYSIPIISFIVGKIYYISVVPNVENTYIFKGDFFLKSNTNLFMIYYLLPVIIFAAVLIRYIANKKATSQK